MQIHMSDIRSFIVKLLSVVSPVVASLVEGVFSEKLKIARVIPIYKSGKQDSTTIYRHISILCFVSKVFECIMFVRPSGICNKFNLLSRNRFGF